MKNVGEYMSDMFGTLLTPSFSLELHYMINFCVNES